MLESDAVATSGTPSRRRLAALIGASLAVLVVLFASILVIRDHFSSVRLVTDTHGGNPSMFMEPVMPGEGQHMVVYGGSLCLDGAGVATITSIEPADGFGDLTVIGYSVFQRHSQQVVGNHRQSAHLSQIPGYAGSDNVGTRCGRQPVEEIALELYKPEAKDAGASDFTVHYVSSGRAKTTNIRLAVAMCEKKGCSPYNP